MTGGRDGYDQGRKEELSEGIRETEKGTLGRYTRFGGERINIPERGVSRERGEEKS